MKSPLNIQLFLAFCLLYKSKQLLLLLLFSMSLQLYLARLVLLTNFNIHCSCQAISSLFFPCLYIFWKDATFQKISIWYYFLFITLYPTLIFSVYLILPTYCFMSISSCVTEDINSRALEIFFYLHHGNAHLLDACHVKGAAFFSNKGKHSYNSTLFLAKVDKSNEEMRKKNPNPTLDKT